VGVKPEEAAEGEVAREGLPGPVPEVRMQESLMWQALSKTTLNASVFLSFSIPLKKPGMGELLKHIQFYGNGIPDCGSVFIPSWKGCHFFLKASPICVADKKTGFPNIVRYFGNPAVCWRS
jgi:hypothetical protein